ncbi:IS5 family transposase [Ruegeria arenilitoris]|uniref:IS5 family transposase n=1 Tax=Ruegeria arenilitoris TaxID=1173585 RepID=UPI003F5C3672
MSHLFWLDLQHLKRIQHLFPKPRGVARSDDRKVLSGIIHVIRNGLRWRDAPAEYGPHKTLYNRFVRWSRLGVFARIFRELAQPGPDGETIMIDSTHLKAHRTAASLSKGGLPRAIGRTKGGLNSKLHTVCDGRGRPLTFLLSAGQMSDAKGALALLGSLPQAKVLLGDKGYDADWFREALAERGINACIPPRRGRRNPADHDTKLYRKRHRVENLFARLKDWRRIATRYDRCGELFLSAICIAASVIFWL